MSDSRTNVRNVPRAETVGSLLRPRALRDHYARTYARREADGPELEREELERVADDAVREVVARQEQAGLDIVSDGEMRRAIFTSSFWDAVSGTEDRAAMTAFHDGDGEVDGPRSRVIVRRLAKVASPGRDEARFLRGITDRPFKVTLPAASNMRFPSTEIDPAAYPDRDQLVAHFVAILNELAHDITAEGGRYVQFDFPIYPLFGDPRHPQPPAGTLDKALRADAAVLDGLAGDVTTALHICRGNYRSRWIYEGSLEAVAERLFNELPYDRFLIEWDDVEREGDYSPLRHLPPGKTVVMGLISSKTRTIEDEDEIVRRLDEASAYTDLDRLALSPQCGFASVFEGNEIDEEVQWRKIDLVCRVADRVWGRA